MTRPIALMTMAVFVLACGGGTIPTRSPAQPATPPATAAPPTAISGSVSAEQLCGLLTPADWQQFNYVTGAQPDVSSDGPGTAVCQYASGLSLEAYVDQNETDAEDTYQTILDNVPFDDPEGVLLIGADEAAFDADIGDDNAGLAMRVGNKSFLITVLAREQALSELTALAALVIARSASLP